MATMRFDGIDKLLADMESLATLPDEVGEGMLNAEADVLVPAQADAARKMLVGPYNKEAVAAAVTKNPVQESGKGKTLAITFEGEQHGNRLAEIAFVNEYGKTNQPARPFISLTNEAKAGEAVVAAADVYDKYLQTKGL